MINKLARRNLYLISSILSLLLIPTTQLFAQEYPTGFSGELHPLYFPGGGLYIPRIDTFNQPGLYQNAILQFDPAIDAWRLDRVVTVPIIDDRIKQVEVIVTESLPAQVYLQMSGRFAFSCGDDRYIDRYIISERRTKEHRSEPTNVKLEVTVTFQDLHDRFVNETPCTLEDNLSFIIHPLKVYGLAAGTYEYVINGTHTGSFELKNDNILPSSLMKTPASN